MTYPEYGFGFNNPIYNFIQHLIIFDISNISLFLKIVFGISKSCLRIYIEIISEKAREKPVKPANKINLFSLT